MLVKLSPYMYLRGQSSVDWALIGDFKEPMFLFGCQRATDLNVSFDAIEQSLLCVAIAAVRCMLSRVAKGDGDGF